MANQTEVQKKAHAKAVDKYRRDTKKVRYCQLQYRAEDYRILEAYCKHVNIPMATWFKQLAKDAIAADTTFTYVPET